MSTETDVYDESKETQDGEQITPNIEPRDSLIRWIAKEKAAAKSHVGKWRAAAKECFRFVDGHQVSDADAKALADAQRPDNAFNSAQKFIRLVTGIEREAPEALIFNPVVENDASAQIHGEFATRCYDWAIAQGDGTFERSRAFYDLIVGGMGWMDYWIDRSRDSRGLPASCRLDPMEMWWPDIDRQNLAGSRWRARETKIDIEEAINRWPDQEKLLMANAGGSSLLNSRFPTADEPVIYTIREVETTGIDDIKVKFLDRSEVEILEWQWYDEELGYYFADPIEESDVWLADKEFRAYRGKLMLAGARIDDYVRQVRRVYKKVFVLNELHRLGEILEIPGNRFGFNPMTAHWDQDSRLWYGYMRILIDPQKYANKFFNQVIEVMAHQAKGGLLYEENSIKPKHLDALNNDYTKPGTSQEVGQDSISQNKIRDKPLPQLPAASIAVLQFCISSMDQVTGLSPQAQFQGSVADTAGVTLRQKQQSSLLLLAQEFGSLSRFRIEEGKIIFHQLGLIADDRLIRVGGAFDGAVIKLLQEPFAIEYELALDDTERDPNIRRMYTENVMALAPTLIRMNKFLPEILDYVTIPVKFRQALKQAIKQNAQAEMMAAQQGIQKGGRGSPVSPEERQAKVQKLQADTQLQLAKVARVEGQKNRDKIRTLMEAMIKAEQLKIDRAKIQLAQRKQVGDEKKNTLDFTGALITEAMASEARQQAARAQAAKRPAAGR